MTRSACSDQAVPRRRHTQQQLCVRLGAARGPSNLQEAGLAGAAMDLGRDQKQHALARQCCPTGSSAA